jgi:hypothetical protein
MLRHERSGKSPYGFFCPIHDTKLAWVITGEIKPQVDKVVERLKEIHRQHLSDLDTEFGSLHHRTFRGGV